MIHDLKILNGNLELDFNEYTYFYTVIVPEDVKALEFSYKLADDTYVEVKNNELDKDENTVVLDVYNVNEDATYTFLVYKEKTDTVSGIDNYMKSLEITNNKEVNLYEVQLLAVGIFFFIIIIFSIIFKVPKNKKNL